MVKGREGTVLGNWKGSDERSWIFGRGKQLILWTLQGGSWEEKCPDPTLCPPASLLPRLSVGRAQREARRPGSSGMRRSCRGRWGHWPPTSLVGGVACAHITEDLRKQTLKASGRKTKAAGNGGRRVPRLGRVRGATSLQQLDAQESSRNKQP